MTTAARFRFGLELEVITGCKSQEDNEWFYCANALSKELGAEQIPNHVNKNQNKSIESYQEWSLIQESTITNNMMQNLCELSPDTRQSKGIPNVRFINRGYGAGLAHIYFRRY